VSSCLEAGTELNVAPAGSGYRRHVLFKINVDNFFVKSDYPDHQGSLSVFALKAGEYQLYPTVLRPFLTPKQVPKAEFTVVAGEVVYVGEYFMTVSCRWSDYQELRDEEPRDMALIEAKNPKLAAMPKAKRMAKFTGLIVGP
jgi:hypothetical protein